MKKNKPKTATNPHFTHEPSTTIKVGKNVSLTLPGGVRVAPDYPYVDTKDHLIDKCLAAWRSEDSHSPPLDFRLVGPPGVGKNATVYALAARRGQALYIIQGHEELTAEDLVVSATLGRDGKVEYLASALLAAMLRGGICFIDELGKMRPRAQAPLASGLDSRRTLYSALLGRSFEAHPDFRFCAAYNSTDADGFDLAPWLRRRTIPEFAVSLPDLDTLESIVRKHTGEQSGLWGKIAERLKQMNSVKKLEVDAGTAIRLLSYVRRLIEYQDSSGQSLGDVYDIAITHVLGRSQYAKQTQAGDTED